MTDNQRKLINQEAIDRFGIDTIPVEMRKERKILDGNAVKLIRDAFIDGALFGNHLPQKGTWQEISVDERLPKNAYKVANHTEEYSIDVMAIGQDGKTYFGYFELPYNKFYYRDNEDIYDKCAVNYMVSWLEKIRA